MPSGCSEAMLFTVSRPFVLAAHFPWICHNHDNLTFIKTDESAALEIQGLEFNLCLLHPSSFRFSTVG